MDWIRREGLFSRRFCLFVLVLLRMVGVAPIFLQFYRPGSEFEFLCACHPEEDVIAFCPCLTGSTADTHLGGTAFRDLIFFSPFQVMLSLS